MVCLEKLFTSMDQAGARNKVRSFIATDSRLSQLFKKESVDGRASFECIEGGSDAALYDKPSIGECFENNDKYEKNTCINNISADEIEIERVKKETLIDPFEGLYLSGIFTKKGRLVKSWKKR